MLLYWRETTVRKGDGEQRYLSDLIHQWSNKTALTRANNLEREQNQRTVAQLRLQQKMHRDHQQSTLRSVRRMLNGVIQSEEEKYVSGLVHQWYDTVVRAHEALQARMKQDMHSEHQQSMLRSVRRMLNGVYQNEEQRYTNALVQRWYDQFSCARARDPDLCCPPP